MEPKKRRRLLKLAGSSLLLLFYLAYVVFVIRAERGPVDYETFMRIGANLLAGGEVYGENSYYPMPFVMVFAFFAWLPRPLSMAVWLLAPVVVALWITRGNPLVLLFAPLFGHFVGGQSAILAMLGLWGYRKYDAPAQRRGGAYLALTLLKPQLGIVPLVYAIWQWGKYIRLTKRPPAQAWVWLGSTLLLYLPGFLILPDWPLRWLHSPRPLFERALAGFLPRTLLFFCSPAGVLYWLVLVGLGMFLLGFIWWFNRKKKTLDLALLWGFVASPLVHDYDLIQLIPLLDTPWKMAAGVLLSIPGWLVILFAYRQDAAWYAFSIIAPGLLCILLRQMRVSASVSTPDTQE